MMAQSNWEADKMLDVYIYDHLVKKKLHNTANSFMTERKVSPDHVAIDTPGGFLFERWSMFLDIYNAKTKEKLLDSAVEYELNVYIYDYLVKKKLHHTAYSFMTEVKVSMDPVDDFRVSRLAVDDLHGSLLVNANVSFAIDI
ncbi:hypothetical protein F2Q68_00001313 [Brassica cretica]|uniref:LisH domain-containing protein n=1 Tax=Brassica cretica TaxID=69181 RepID=A0A8S9J9D6_BRACR|nr:hypothetical protein F2Q68_00001313 [Brassica cretica]